MNNNPQQNTGLHFLSGGSEMGQLTRLFDWEKTPLGAPDYWPQSLKTTLSIMLNSKFPMFLWWGPQLLCFYNDAYRPSLGNDGKHPSILGMPAAEAWAEIWPVIEPLIKQVLAGGESTWSEDQLIPIYRNGHMEDVYWTFSYSPVKDETGHISGVLVTCTETTAKVMTNLSLQQTNEQLRQLIAAEVQSRRIIKESISSLQLIIHQAQVAIAIFRGAQYIVETVHARALQLWGRTEAEVLNKPILEAMPELKSQGIKELLDDVYLNGNSFSATELPVELKRNRQIETAFINFIYEPLYDADGIINGLITIGFDITEQVNARKAVVRLNDELAIMNEELMATNEELRLINNELADTQGNLNEVVSRLSESEVKLLQAIDTGRMGTWGINPATLEVNMSAFIKELFGFPLHREPTMEEIMLAIHPDYHQMLTDVLTNAIQNHQSSDTEYPITNQLTGEQKWVRATGKVFTDENGNATQYSGLLMDITEKKLDELRKNDFIGMVSHELKTPLTTLTAIVQVLQNKLKNSDDTFLTGAMDKANVQTRKMNTMINGFLNISRLESGKIYLNLQHFELNDLLIEMIDEVKLTVTSHDIIFMPHETINVYADRDKIGSVISNLLSNAVKYSAKGKKINLDCRVTDKIVTISVKDEGIGINEQHMERLFERYYRVESNNTRHISGFGIGLYLSAEIIKRHGGDIWAESESGAGSTFYFTLPVA